MQSSDTATGVRVNSIIFSVTSRMLETNKQALVFNFGEDLSYFVILRYKLRDSIQIYDDFENDPIKGDFQKTLLFSFRKPKVFGVADFATLSDESRSRSKFFYYLIWIKEPCVRKSEGFTRSKILGISQTILFQIGKKRLVEYKWPWLRTIRKSLLGLSFMIDYQMV